MPNDDPDCRSVDRARIKPRAYVDADGVTVAQGTPLPWRGGLELNDTLAAYPPSTGAFERAIWC
jgi:hypothetical protein